MNHKENKKDSIVHDEYTDDYPNEELLRKTKNKWFVKVGVSHTPRIGKKVKFKDANYMP